MEKWFTPIEVAPLPKAQRVLAIAPHPDDEIFGCGGALYLFAQNAAKINVKVVTEGAGYAADKEREAIFFQRMKESQNALKLLNEDIDVEFWEYKDRSLLQSSELVERIVKLCEDLEPDLILAPSPWEIHPDHIACSRAVWAATSVLRKNFNRTVGLMFYEIGSPLRTNMLLDITSCWDIKNNAMHCFTSQLAQQDYARHIDGLNTFRTYTLPANVLKAEAFYFLDTKHIPEAALEVSVEMADGGAALCMNRWIESVISTATVHAENLQKSLIEQMRHSDGLLEQLNALQTQHAALQFQMESYQEEKAFWTAERNDLNQKISEIQESHNKQMDEIYQSTSWKLTAPLRKIRNFLK